MVSVSRWRSALHRENGGGFCEFCDVHGIDISSNICAHSVLATALPHFTVELKLERSRCRGEKYTFA